MCGLVLSRDDDGRGFRAPQICGEPFLRGICSLGSAAICGGVFRILEVWELYQALYRKWRSKTFDEVVGQEHITETLKRQVANDRLSHAYLFTGTRGTGKTSCAKILARAVNCEHPVNGNPCNQCPSCLGIENGSILDVLELDAASNNGVDHVRALRDEAIYTPSSVKKRVYIVDEVHMLSTAAFNALLKILEEPPSHLMFILATTELHKVPATIKSRCQQFAFKRILPDEIAGRLAYVAQQESIELTDGGASLLARLADGGLRDALSLLDQCAGPGGVIDENRVTEILGLAGNLQTSRLLEQAADKNTGGALETMARLYAEGKDIKALLGELASLVRDLLVAKTAPKGGKALLTGGYDQQTIETLGNQFTSGRLLQMLTVLQNALSGLSQSNNLRIDGELCLIRLCDETLDGSTEGLISRVARLEQIAESGTPVRFVSEQPAKQGGSTPQEQKPVPERKPITQSTDASPPPWETEPPQFEKDDSPPWEVTPQKTQAVNAPPKQEQPAKTPPAPVRQDPPKSAPKTTPSTGGDGSGFWSGLVARISAKVPRPVYMTLRDSGETDADYADGVLTIYVTQFAYARLNRADVLDALKQGAEQQAGTPVRVMLKEGTAPKPEPAVQSAVNKEKPVDPLDGLMDFDIVKFK